MKHEKTREYDGLSDRAAQILKSEEGLDIEYKQSLEALDISDIVAMANCETGGTIMVGIRDTQLKNGRQKGVIVGCRVGDKAKMQLISKINSIIPQMEVDIIIENARDKPFYRIEVPSGASKPYCTSSGIYKIRDDGYSKPMKPDMLLQLFLRKETFKFQSRFDRATDELEQSFNRLSNRLVKELDDVENAVNGISRKTDELMSKLEPDE